MKKIELVVFDMAGTTVRDDDAVNRCLRDALAAASVEVTRDEVNGVMGLPKPTAIKLLLEQKQGGTAQTEKVDWIHDDFLRRMIEFYKSDPDVESMPHAVQTLLRLKKNGIKRALDTGFSRPIVDAILNRLGWGNGKLVDATVASDEVPRGRPYPDLIFRAMAMTGVTDPKAVAKVGDTPSDLKEGTAAGCGLVIGVTNGSHTEAELADHPHTHLIPSLETLPDLVLQPQSSAPAP